MAGLVTLLVPDGHLQDQAVRLLTLAGLLVTTGAADKRCYLLTTSVKWLSAQLARPPEVAVAVCRGEADLGICGVDTIEEAGGDCVKVLDLGFGLVRLCLMVPKSWTDVNSAEELLAKRIDGGLLVWSEYPLITQRFFSGLPCYRALTQAAPSLQLWPWHEEQTGSPITIRLSFGKTEAKMVSVDVVASGRTADANGRKSIAIVLKGSTACLIASRQATADPWKAGLIYRIADSLAGVLKEGRLGSGGSGAEETDTHV